MVRRKKFGTDRKFIKDKEWLIEEYINKGRSRKDIAQELGMTVAGIKCVLEKYGVKKPVFNLPKEELEKHLNNGMCVRPIARLYGVTSKVIDRLMKKCGLEIKVDPHSRDQYDDSNDELICSLYTDGWSSTAIAKELGTTHTVILRHLKHCGIERRSLSESQWNHNNKKFPEELKNKDTLYELYINQKLSKKDLSEKFDCSAHVIDRILREFEIPVRGDSECKIGLITGEKHWNWKGGISPLYMRLRQYLYDWTSSLALKRDHYKCTICGSKHQLQVHHIVPFKQLFQDFIQLYPNLDPIEDVNELYELGTKYEPFLDQNNLITYCKECHLFKIHGYKKKDSLADNKPLELLETPESSKHQSVTDLEIGQSAANP